jgi:hypothetical protein
LRELNRTTGEHLETHRGSSARERDVLGQPVLTWMGMEIMTAGGIVIIVAQVQMGASWRIGLDWERKALATEGLSRWSRSFLRPMLASSVTT